MNGWIKTSTYVLTSVLLAACGSGSDNAGDTGTLTIGLTDATVHDVEEVRIWVTGLSIKGPDGPPEQYPVSLPACDSIDDPTPLQNDDCNPIDLLLLADAAVVPLIEQQEMTVGEYQWIRIEVDESLSYIVPDEGGQLPIDVNLPSERGLQLSGGFVVLANQLTHVAMDWDVYQGLTNPVGRENEYILKPTIRLVDMAEYGTISGSVADVLVMADGCENDPATGVGNAVYVFEGDVTPDDIDNNEPEPMVTAQVEMQEDGSYAYAAHFLPVGEYTVAFTCQGMIDNVPATEAVDDADDAMEFLVNGPITVENGETTDVSFI